MKQESKMAIQARVIFEHMKAVEQYEKVKDSTEQGYDKQELVDSFKIDGLQYDGRYLELGAGFYITVFKGHGQFNTTVNQPFELNFYKFDENGSAFLKWNNKKVTKIVGFGYLDRVELEERVNEFIQEKK